jgi:hypothetical protein
MKKSRGFKGIIKLLPSFEIITKLVRKKSGGRDGPDSHSLLATPSILLVDWKTQTHVEKNTQSWRTREVMEDTGSVEKTGDYGKE